MEGLPTQTQLEPAFPQRLDRSFKIQLLGVLQRHVAANTSAMIMLITVTLWYTSSKQYGRSLLVALKNRLSTSTRTRLATVT